MSYASDRAWSDRYLPIMRLLIGPHLLTPSPLEVDTKQAADLIVLRGRDMTIACRIRRHGYADRYPWDITIRSRRDAETFQHQPQDDEPKTEQYPGGLPRHQQVLQ